MLVCRSLISRVERSAAQFETSTAAAYRQIDPDDPATARPLGQGALVALGPGRYVNRAIGITLEDPADATLDEIEAFFATADLPPSIEVSSWASTPVLDRLAARGYRPDWFRNVYVRLPAAPVDTGADPSGPVIHPVDEDSLGDWQRVFAASFEYSSNHDLATALRYTEALRLVPGTTHLVATHDGEAVACASLNVVDGVGWLGGAATIPQLRGHGVHADLLDHRLALAIELGCDILAATALPSGSSARNLHRAGFQLGWTQVVMTR